MSVDSNTTATATPARPGLLRTIAQMPVVEAR
jgi:hypothetical protein